MCLKYKQFFMSKQHPNVHIILTNVFVASDARYRVPSTSRMILAAGCVSPPCPHWRAAPWTQGQEYLCWLRQELKVSKCYVCLAQTCIEQAKIPKIFQADFKLFLSRLQAKFKSIVSSFQFYIQLEPLSTSSFCMYVGFMKTFL